MAKLVAFQFHIREASVIFIMYNVATYQVPAYIYWRHPYRPPARASRLVHSSAKGQGPIGEIRRPIEVNKTFIITNNQEFVNIVSGSRIVGSP